MRWPERVKGKLTLEAKDTSGPWYFSDGSNEGKSALRARWDTWATLKFSWTAVISSLKSHTATFKCSNLFSVGLRITKPININLAD